MDLNVLSSRCVLSLVEDSAREARRKRTIISPRTKIFVQAFMRVHFPAIAAREELAHQTGIPEPRIQVSSPASAWAQDMTLEKGEFSPAKRLELDTRRLGLELGLGLGGRGLKVSELSGGFCCACGRSGTPHFPGPRDTFSENGPAEVALGLTDQRPGSQVGCQMGTVHVPAR